MNGWIVRASHRPTRKAKYRMEFDAKTFQSNYRFKHEITSQYGLISVGQGLGTGWGGLWVGS